MATDTTLSVKKIFGDTRLSYGKKHPHDTRLIDLWGSDRGYLLWAANADASSKKKCDNPLPTVQQKLVLIANSLELGNVDIAQLQYDRFQQWHRLTQEGIGLDILPRPNAKECFEDLAKATVLAGHSDLDGLYSMALVIRHAGALRGGAQSGKIPFDRLRVVNYSFRNLQQYTSALNFSKDDSLVIIDFAAHPKALLTFDHHSTCLMYWELDEPIPRGVFDTSMPSCPRLLATYCGLTVSEDILSGCDMIDGALYPSIESTYDLSNPFVALELCLSVDVSDVVAKKVVITLAENDLDPYSVLSTPIWEARRRLGELQLEEQRSYWSKPTRYNLEHSSVAIADSRFAPYSASRFRYLPFEKPEVLERPFCITIRGAGAGEFVNLGVSRNPFFKEPKFFAEHPISLGALCASVGRGGGRVEVGSTNIQSQDLKKTIERVVAAIEVA